MKPRAITWCVQFTEAILSKIRAKPGPASCDAAVCRDFDSPSAREAETATQEDDVSPDGRARFSGAGRGERSVARGSGCRRRLVYDPRPRKSRRDSDTVAPGAG